MAKQIDGLRTTYACWEKTPCGPDHPHIVARIGDRVRWRCTTCRRTEITIRPLPQKNARQIPMIA